MKKIIISVIAVLIIASGITCFIFYSKDKKPDDSHNKGIVNEKVDIKDNEVFSEDSETNKDKIKEQSIDKSSKSTEENKNESKNNQKQPEHKRTYFRCNRMDIFCARSCLRNRALFCLHNIASVFHFYTFSFRQNRSKTLSSRKSKKNYAYL